MSSFSRIARSVPSLFKTPVRFKSTESEAAATASKPASGYSFSYFLPNDPGVAFLMAVGLGAIGWLKTDIMGIRSEMVQVRSEMAQDRTQAAAGFAQVNSRLDQIFVLMVEEQKSKKALEKAESGGRSFCS